MCIEKVSCVVSFLGGRFHCIANLQPAFHLGEVCSFVTSNSLEMLVASVEERWSTTAYRCNLLKVTLDMVSQLVSLYKGFHSLPEILAPLENNLAR